jgi:glycosyltransferase involved in cell wall biosynthesis
MFTMSTYPPISSAADPEIRCAERAKTCSIFIIHPSAVLTDWRPHGDGLLSYRFIRELALRGHRLCVACEQVDLRDPVPKNITLYPIKLRLTKFVLAERLEYVLKVRRLYKRLNAAEHFDIAHQLNPVEAGLSLGLTGIEIPLVLGPYVAYWPFARASKFKAFILDAVNRLQQRSASAIVLSGPAAATRIVSKRIPADSIFTVPYGIDLNLFPEQPFPTDAALILYLGGFIERKGVFVLLQAFDELAARIPKARLVLAGGGAERERGEQIVAQSPFRDRISIVGPVARADIPKMIGNATVFCLPSFAEPYGMSLIEAMATGRPVVATSVGGPTHLVDRRGGILVEPGNPHALAAALETILLDPKRAGEMGVVNRRAMRAFDWPMVIDRLEAVYASVLRDHRSR